LPSKKLFLFDLDGVLYIGKDAPKLIGGVKLIKELKKKGKKVFVLTNTSTHTRKSLQKTLRKLGFPIEVDEILTSSRLAAEYVKQKWGSCKCYLIGEEGFKKELEDLGHKIVENEQPDIVIVGLDRNLTYEKLNKSLIFLRNGAKLVSSSVARVYMDRYGPAIGVGAIAKSLEYSSGKKVISVGKPSPLMFKLALKKADVKAKDAVMIGDQIETDVAGAKKVGIFSILVKTGVDKEVITKPEPDIVINNIDELLHYI
jgi:HAD superfamily hydrolase (TIGR01450 family)